MLVHDYLAALDAFPEADLSTVAGQGPILVMAPHQDDESLGCGGLIAALTAAGRAVTVVFVTDGAGSHPNSKAVPPPRLAALRRNEATTALAVLGVPAGCIHFMDLPDTAAPVEGEAFEGAVSRLRAIADQAGIATVFCTSGLDPHCDHEASALMAVALRTSRPALRLLFYPVWSWHLSPDRDLDVAAPTGHRFPIGLWLALKREAIQCHVSQMTDLIGDDPTGFRFTDGQLAPFLRPFEIFIEAQP